MLGTRRSPAVTAMIDEGRGPGGGLAAAAVPVAAGGFWTPMSAATAVIITERDRRGGRFQSSAGIVINGVPNGTLIIDRVFLKVS